MSANTPAPGTPDSQELPKNPNSVNIQDVGLVLGKGIGALHLRSGYGTDKGVQGVPRLFEYGPATMDEVLSEVGKYEDIKPKVFKGAHNAAEYIRGNSMFATDTYVLELPGDIVIIYQLTLIHEIYNALIEKTATGYNVKKIIDLSPIKIPQILENQAFTNGKNEEYSYLDKNGNPHPDMDSVNRANNEIRERGYQKSIKNYIV